jgi:HlyD family secretion protein
VLTIGDPAHPYVDVFVPQQELAGVRVGARATIRVDATAQPFAGKVEHVSRRTEFTPRYIFSRKERATLVVRVRVRVDDPQHALHAGVPAFVTIGGA